MSNRTARGTKRKCQNEDCALPFYDLNRASFACPTCGSAFNLALEEAQSRESERRASMRWSPRPLPKIPEPIDEPAADPVEPAALEDVAIDDVADDAAVAGPDLILEEDESDDAVEDVAPGKTPGSEE